MTTLTSLTCQGRLMKALRQHRTPVSVQIGVQHNARARRHSTQQYNDERQEYVLCALERALCIGIAARPAAPWRVAGRRSRVWAACVAGRRRWLVSRRAAAAGGTPTRR